MASLYKQALVSYLKERSYKADQVLDVGGGDTSITKYTNVEANRVLTLDINGDFNPNYIHDLNDFGHPEDIFAIERNPHFDLIFCMNVFEYIWNPYNAISNLYTWLAPDGRLVVNFPFLYPLHNPVGVDYLRYTHEWVEKMFRERFRFSSVNINIIEATAGAADLQRFYHDEKMHHRKGDSSWKEIGCVVEAVK